MPNLISHNSKIGGLIASDTVRKSFSEDQHIQNSRNALSYLDIGNTTPSSGSNLDLLPEYQPAQKPPKASSYLDLGVTIPSSAYSLDLPVEAPVVIERVYSAGADSIPLQIWEGTVLELDAEEGVMHVMLNAKLNQVPRHSADISLEWVSDQDKDLVCLGAVFYLTLFKRTKRGSIENAQELRFRRRPSWTQRQLDSIDEESSVLLSKMKQLPTVE